MISRVNFYRKSKFCKQRNYFGVIRKSILDKSINIANRETIDNWKQRLSYSHSLLPGIWRTGTINQLIALSIFPDSKYLSLKIMVFFCSWLTHRGNLSWWNKQKPSYFDFFKLFAQVHKFYFINYTLNSLFFCKYFLF